MDHKRLERALKKAWTLFDAGRLDLAVEQGMQALELAPEDDALDLEVGVLCFRAERCEQALERFRAAARKNPGNLTAYVNAAKTLVRLGRPEEALATTERGLELEGGHTGLWVTAGECALTLGRPEEALERFVRACELKPREGEAWRQRSVALRELGRLEEALAAVSESCAVQPNNPDALWERARCLRALGRPADAWRYLVDALRIRGADSERSLYFDAAVVAYETERFGDAIRIAETLIARDRDDAEAWVVKGRALEASGQGARGAISVGTGYLARGELDKALEALDRAIAKDPGATPAWCNRAVVLERMGRPEDALASYDEALVRDPMAATVWHNKGVLLLTRLEREEDAIACFRREVSIDHRRWFDLDAQVRKLLGSP